MIELLGFAFLILAVMANIAGSHAEAMVWAALFGVCAYGHHQSATRKK